MRERPIWLAVSEFPAAANARLTRLFDLCANADVTAIVSRAASAALELSQPLTLVLVDATAGAVTITLPRAQDAIGCTVVIKRKAGANTVTLAAASGQSIDSSASVTAPNRVVSDGVQWWTV